MPETPDVPSIVADRRESASGIPAHLETHGARVRLAWIDAGDYFVAADTRVERKTVRDLGLTVVEGRFWTQMNRLRASCAYPMLLVEGRQLGAGPLAPSAVRGVLIALMERGVQVIFTENTDDSARWLMQLARRRQGATKRYLRPPFIRPTGERDSTAVAALCAIPNVSIVTARALLHRFGTLRQLATASQDEIETVEGVGPTRARSVVRTFDSGST